MAAAAAAAAVLRVRPAGTAGYAPFFLAAEMSPADIERAVSLAVGLAPGMFGLRNAEGVSGVCAGLVGAWDADPLPSPPAAGARVPAAPSFASDVALLEDTHRCALTQAQREAFRAREFDYAREALRERRFDTGRMSVSLLLAHLNGHLTTATHRRLSSAAGGACLGGLLAGFSVRGRAADLFCAVRVADGAAGEAKVYHAAATHFGARGRAHCDRRQRRVAHVATARRCGGGSCGGSCRRRAF